MQTGFQFFPEQASTFAPRVDALYGFLIGVSAFFGGLICILVIVFAVKYRRRPGRRAAPTRDLLGLELVWTVIPAMFVLVMFVWGASLYLDQMTPPKGAEDI